MVILLGRPNVGKSTLFNRLIGKKEAIVSSIAGTTLNRKDGLCYWLGQTVRISDIAGLPIAKSLPQYQAVMEQIDNAFKMAEVFILVVDQKDGLTHDDLELLRLIRKTGKQIALAINKVDDSPTPGFDQTAGIDAVFMISALHGRGISELLDFISQFSETIKPNSRFKTVFIGRQNVGKSTLFNHILKQNRSIVSEEPGTTREPIEMTINTPRGSSVTFIDTAGVRRRGKIVASVERQAVSSTFDAIRRAQAVVGLFNAVEGPTRQDIHLIDYALKNRKPTLIAVNKWDLIRDITDKKHDHPTDAYTMIVSRFPALKDIPIIPIAAEQDWNVDLVTKWLEHVQRSSSGGSGENS